jgi:hypothetical protein
VLTRTRDDTHLQELLDAGDTGSESYACKSHAADVVGTGTKDPSDYQRNPSRSYRMLRGFFHGESLSTDFEENATGASVLHAVIINREAWACGKTVDQLYWPIQHNPLVKVRRDGKVIPAEVVPNLRLEENDLLLLQGSFDEVERCEEYLLTGH